jgi:hypothetical protein
VKTVHSLLRALGIFAAVGGACSAADFQKEIRPLLDKHCYACHGAEKGKGGVRLHEFTDARSLFRDPKLWEKVADQIHEEAMPPDNKPQPTTEERALLTEWVKHTLENPEPSWLPRDPGRFFLHRLSKREYNNTVRDLLGVTSQPADEFPPDGGGGGGFDNNSATLFIPPVLVEKYLTAAASLLKEAKPDRLFAARGDTRKTIAEFATQAFRRPVEAEEIEPLVQLADQVQKRGESWEDAVKTALRAVLVSPNFLFRIEQPQGAEAHPVNDFELANRLSYFLWSTMPDAELFRVAGEKKLREPAVLEAQVKRMLRDPKARDFAENFAGQWLRVHELESSAQPDTRRFPEYTPALREALITEPIEFFHAMLRDDASLLQILDADYTYANELLAKHYGISDVSGTNFRRVALADRNRGGVMTMGAVLTITSYPRRTSPVLRGKWVLEEILGTPAPPPPPLVESLPSSDKVRDGLTFRQQLEKHRTKAACAGCHSRLDPLGFGLENFDAIGRWRTEIADQPVDASGELVSGEKFSGPAELKTQLLKRKDFFIRNVTEKMYAYALNRGLEPYDMPIVKQAAKKLAASDYRIQTLVMDIVKSYPFTHRRGTTPLVSQNP